MRETYLCAESLEQALGGFDQPECRYVFRDRARSCRTGIGHWLRYFIPKRRSCAARESEDGTGEPHGTNASCLRGL